MDGDDLFLNFKSKQEPIVNKDKDFIGKNRSNGKSLVKDSLQENKRQNIDENVTGQNLNT